MRFKVVESFRIDDACCGWLTFLERHWQKSRSAVIRECIKMVAADVLSNLPREGAPGDNGDVPERDEQERVRRAK